MDRFADTNLADKASKKFYDRIRSHLDDLVLLDPNAKSKTPQKDRDVPEEDQYGLIPQRQLRIILRNYDKEPDKPAHSDEFEAGSLAKLLFSRASFHDASSTCYLIDDLQINDTSRNSFLSGHSNYSTNTENSLAHLRACQLRMKVVDEVKNLIFKIDNVLDKQPVLPQELDDEIDQLTRAGHGISDILVLSGKRHIVNKKYDQAIDDLESAINSQCKHLGIAKENLSEALSRKGLFYLHGGQIEKASDYFNQSLIHNRDNETAQFHLSMVQGKMRREERRVGFDSNKSYQRRR